MTDPVTVSPPRQRMLVDMTIRQFGEHTQRDYVRQVREFTAFLGRSPDQAEPEDLRRYQLHLASFGVSYSRMNQACTALRFFFHVTLGRTGLCDRMARIPTPERLPVVLGAEEVALLLAHAPNLKYRAALSITYGCGLRVSEIANLNVAEIDSARMLIRVEQGSRTSHGLGRLAGRGPSLAHRNDRIGTVDDDLGGERAHPHYLLAKFVGAKFPCTKQLLPSAF